MKKTIDQSPTQRHDRGVMSLDDFTAEDIAAIEQAPPPAEAAQFDHEVD